MSAEGRIFGVKDSGDISPAFMTKNDFGRYIARSEATVNRLIKKGVIVPVRDGRSVRIPVKDALRRYLRYVAERQKNDVSLKPEAPSSPPIHSDLADRAFAMGDFIVKDATPPSAPEQSGDKCEE